MAKTKDDITLHTRFISVVPLEKPGVIEFQAWEKAQFLYIWQKPWNERTTVPHLAFIDCPTLEQRTYRMLILEGQAQLPIDPDEDWAPMQLGWTTRRSFATLWMSKHCYTRQKELKRGSLTAVTVETKARHKPDIEAPEEEEAYIP